MQHTLSVERKSKKHNCVINQTSNSNENSQDNDSLKDVPEVMIAFYEGFKRYFIYCRN